MPSSVLRSAGSHVLWAASFAWNRSCSIPFFRTGDLGRLGPSGLEIVGRIDNEVKVGGVCSSLCILLIYGVLMLVFTVSACGCLSFGLTVYVHGPALQ